ncbi:hypothetical protein MTO96_004296 [Rhipicephalus appendiculatus]
MASSSEPAGETTPEEREKQVTAWLRKMLKRSVREELDDDEFDTLFKFMKLQAAAEEEAQERIKVLKERTKFFEEKAEHLEAGLRAGKIAPDQLPKEACDIVKTHAKAAVLLGVKDSQPESFEEKFEELSRQSEELKARESKLQASVENLEQLEKRMEQHLTDAAITYKHMTAAEEEYRLRKWQRAVSKFNFKQRKEKECQSRRQKLEELTQTLSLSKKLRRLQLRVKGCRQEAAQH